MDINFEPYSGSTCILWWFMVKEENDRGDFPIIFCMGIRQDKLAPGHLVNFKVNSKYLMISRIV